MISSSTVWAKAGVEAEITTTLLVTSMQYRPPAFVRFYHAVTGR
jgi:hypothetical protein